MAQLCSTRIASMLALAAIAGCNSSGSGTSGAGFGTEALGVTLGDIIHLVGVQSGRCIGVVGDSTADQAALELRDCNSATSQQLRLETAEGYYVLRVVGSDRCLAVSGGSSSAGASIVQATCTGAASQQWSGAEVGGAYRITSRASGMAIDAYGAGTANGTKIIQWPETAGANQQWMVVAAGEVASYTVTLATSGSGTTSPAPGAYTVQAGTTGSATATPATGYTFTGWSGSATGTANPLTVTVNGNMTLTANFAPTATSYTVTLATSGSGTTSPAPGAYTVPAGTTGTVTATPATGFTFTGWSGSATGTANPLTVTVNGNMTLTANFASGEPCQDSCPVANGLTWECRKRFALGTNWAWHNFAADFGGIAAWNQSGVSQNASAYQNDLAAMKAKKAGVIRWWMFPRFWSSGISFDANDVPQGVGGSLIADVQEGLELAEQADTYLVLTLFSFDNFKPTAEESGIHTPGLQPMVLDASKRRKLLDNVIAPIAAAVEASPYRKRVLAWDMINEPEWAMTGPNPYGNDPFEAQSGLQAVTHSQMVTFLNELAAALRAHSSAQLTLGAAAIKWGTAWTHLDLDFYQLHYYDWVYEWYPYGTVTLQSQGLTDKPVVMGEFPNAGLSAIPSKNLPARTASQFASDLLDHGYAGALSWSYTDTSFPWSSLDLETFGNAHACETSF